jgi:hypothetical protein
MPRVPRNETFEYDGPLDMSPAVRSRFFYTLAYHLSQVYGDECGEEDLVDQAFGEVVAGAGLRTKAEVTEDIAPSIYMWTAHALGVGDGRLHDFEFVAVDVDSFRNHVTRYWSNLLGYDRGWEDDDDARCERDGTRCQNEFGGPVKLLLDHSAWQPFKEEILVALLVSDGYMANVNQQKFFVDEWVDKYPVQ